jgi:hypothetical protein
MLIDSCTCILDHVYKLNKDVLGSILQICSRVDVSLTLSFVGRLVTACLRNPHLHHDFINNSWVVGLFMDRISGPEVRALVESIDQNASLSREVYQLLVAAALRD